MRYRKCEICGLKSARHAGVKRYFMARLPLDEARCRQWVKVIGKEDFAYVPIEKLHQAKFVCGKHFRDQDFSKKKTQLKKNAVPTLRLTAPPLSDEILTDFPYHIFSATTSSNQQHAPENSTHIDELETPPGYDTEPMKQKYTSDHSYCTQDNIESAQKIDYRETDDYNPNVSPLPLEEELETLDEDLILVNKPFSWQNQNKAVPIAAEEIETDIIDVSGNLSMYCDDETAAPTATEDYVEGQNEGRHEGYQCNTCSDDIIGYRYTCVQCTDYDLCSACEASGVHPHHYVLRVPGPRPQKEIQAVLEKIRSDLNLYFESPSCDADVISVKSETKEEPEEFDDHELIGETLNIPDTEEYDDDPLSMHNKQTNYLGGALPIWPFPHEKKSYTIKNITADKEDNNIDKKMVAEPNVVEERKPLTRTVTINKLDLIKVSKIVSLLPNKRIRLVVKRRPNTKDTTQPNISKENSECSLMREETKLVPKSKNVNDKTVFHMKSVCVAKSNMEMKNQEPIVHNEIRHIPESGIQNTLKHKSR